MLYLRRTIIHNLMLIESSKDLLYIVLAFCLLWLTVFLSWLLYYLIAIVRDAEHLVRPGSPCGREGRRGWRTPRTRRWSGPRVLTLVAQALRTLAVWAVREKMLKEETRRTKVGRNDEE